MAHNLEIINGVASFAENGLKETAWHGLGQVFDGEMDVATALAASHADFTVAKTPVYYQSKNGGFAANPEFFHIIREDNGAPLGLVKKSYGVVQNADAFEFVNGLCTGGNSKEPFIECAGVLGKGERVFITAKFPERFQVGDVFGDDAEMYAVITTSHDGSGAVTVMLTPIRVVCNNTLQAAMGHNYSKFCFRHTSNVKLRMKENMLHVAKTLGCFEATKKAVIEHTKQLNAIKADEKTVKFVCGRVAFGDKYPIFENNGFDIDELGMRNINVYYDLRESVENGIGQDLFKSKSGNWLFNGITNYFQNVKTYTSKGEYDAEKKFDNIINGGTAHAKIMRAYTDILMAA